MLEILRLEIPDSFELKNYKKQIFKMFAQTMLNRLFVGEIRYGPAEKKQHYFSRLKKEVAVYQKTGNAEQLINIANYCVLEWIAPEHPKHHFNPTVESVTREDAKGSV
jgi:hypothetical protein